MATCAACGLEAPAGARFCPSCGAALTDAQAPEEMLKLVTVLFADVVGSTARAERLHPEDVRALMADYFAAMAGEIQAEGGTLEKFVGDAIMAVFGVPVAHEDDAVRAVRAALRMVERLRAWNEDRDAAQRLELRIGVNTGDVVAAGAPGGELLVTGDAVNVAARLQQAAEPGTIVVGARTARAARSQFVLRPLGDSLSLKGKSEPVVAWVVEAERDAEEAHELRRVLAPLVGRDHELASLRTSYERVCRERRPALVTLVGDAGVGKSRLLRDFLAPLEVDAKLLIGRCLPHGEGVTLWPLAEMLKAEAVVLDSDAADVAAAKISQLVETSIAADVPVDRQRTAAALASTLGLQLPADPLASADPGERYRELVAAWLALLGSMGRRAPVVAVVEDLHWADARMLDVLDELAERLDGPILFLCTARPDLLRLRPEWGGGRRSFSSLPLDPLTAAETEQLAAHLVDVEALPATLRRRILDRSEGNPFFLEEIVRHLIDEELLVHDGGRWRAGTDVDRVEIPDSVQAVILARLDLLSPVERRVAQRAAVVGRVFWDGAVAATAGVDELDAALRTLRRREFVVEALSSAIAGQTEFVFKHVLIRDVAYESLPRRERGHAHATTAEWIERTRGEGGGEVAELLAHHYEAAFTYLGEDEFRRKARAELLKAAASAHRKYAIEQGEEFARRAVELSQGSDERVEALETLGDLHYHFGDAAWRAYVEALAELSAEDPRFPRLSAKAGEFGARWIGTMRELPTIGDVRRTIEAGLRAAPEGSRERALLLVDRGFVTFQREQRQDGIDRMVAEALAAAERIDDPNVLSAALDLALGVEMSRGRYGEKFRLSQRRTALVPRMTNVREIADAYAMVAWSAQHLGRYPDAERGATACIERSRGLDAGAYLHGLTWRVAARFMLGDWDAALEDHAELERVAARAPNELPAGYTVRAYAFAALCHELRGERSAADAYVDLVWTYLDRRRAVRQMPASIHAPPLALALAARGRVDEARESIPLARPGPAAGVTLEALCEIAALEERWDEASELVAAAREEATIGEQVSLTLYADRLEGRAAAAGGDVPRAAKLLGRSADGFAQLEAAWEEAWSRLLLAEVLVAIDRARAERELAAALPVFEALRSVREVERAHALRAAALA